VPAIAGALDALSSQIDQAAAALARLTSRQPASAR
jgi:hypothetical protein